MQYGIEHAFCAQLYECVLLTSKTRITAFCVSNQITFDFYFIFHLDSSIIFLGLVTFHIAL